MKKITKFTGACLVAALTMVCTGSAFAAKGSGGGRTFEVATNEGSCKLADGITNAPLVSTSMVLRSSQGVNYFIMQALGENSAGTWEITFTKNGVQGSPTIMDFPPPGGWAVVGGSVDKGAKSINAVGVARNIDNGTVCTSQIARVF